MVRVTVNCEQVRSKMMAAALAKLRDVLENAVAGLHYEAHPEHGATVEMTDKGARVHACCEAFKAQIGQAVEAAGGRKSSGQDDAAPLR